MSDAKDEQGKQAVAGEPAAADGPVDSAKGEKSPPAVTKAAGSAPAARASSRCRTASRWTAQPGR